MELELKPNLEDLSKIETLSLAQKKANYFIRKYNWYCDHIDLDKENIGGVKVIEKWARNLNNLKLATQKIDLILAPKSNHWEYSNDVWKPKDPVKLRPLAGVTYRDQTYGIAALMTIANIIETIQGPSFLNGNDAKYYNVKSYGNRLFCHWENENGTYKAKFSLGSNQIYRKYFEDFENFIKRPKEICDLNVSLGVDEEDLIILSYDIKDFFDNIDIEVLLSKLKKILINEIGSYDSMEEYLATLKKLLTFEVDKYKVDNKNILKVLKGYTVGLPQGLGASGFFSNVYMYEFDNNVEDKIKDTLKDEIEVVDYIRYVDDIRIIVKKKGKLDTRNISKKIESILNSYFIEYCDGEENAKIPQINSGKTEYTTYKKLKYSTNGYNELRAIQSKISTAPDYETLTDVLNKLDNIIEISKINPVENTATKFFSIFDSESINDKFHDIKSESIQRFAGFRVYKSILLKQKLFESQVISKLSYEEYVSMLIGERKKYVEQLINLWLTNPSLFHFLRYSLDLLPYKKLVRKIFEVLDSVDNTSESEGKYISYFIKMDMFIASINYIGYSNKNEYDQLKLREFRKEIVELANETLKLKDIPNYLKNSAILVILSFGQLLTNSKGLKLESNYKKLVQFYFNEINISEIKEDSLVYYLLVYQLNNNIDYLVRTINHLHVENKELVPVFLDMIESYNFDTIYEIYKYSDLAEEVQEIIKMKFYVPQKIKLINGGKYRLIDVIANGNPLKDENSILAIIESILFNQVISAKIASGIVDFSNFKIIVKDWSSLSNPLKARQKLIELEVDESIKRSFAFPEWCDSKEKKISYFLGAVLRAALSSRLDYLSNKHLEIDQLGYKGIKYSKHIKRISLNHYRDNINNSEYPITKETMELLFNLLWYPGLFIPIDTLNYFGNLTLIKTKVTKILDEREQFYCSNSKLPTYVHKLNKDYSNRNKIRVLSVQSLFPREEDFAKVFPNFVSEKFRKQHRQHLAEIIELIKSYLKVQAAGEAVIDIVVFPEISVNVDDLDLLEQLSDETNAHIFAGLTYSYMDEKEETFKNEALWILRDEINGGRNFIKIKQGKKYPTKPEIKMGVVDSKSNQIIIEFSYGEVKFRVAGAICYDATDINLASDLRHKSDLFIISAYNKDIATFDNMVAALNYHMYQPIVLVNSGHNGGSMVQAPYSGHDKIFSSLHGGKQVAISLAEFNISDFKNKDKSKLSNKVTKTSPAGFNGRN